MRLFERFYHHCVHIETNDDDIGLDIFQLFLLLLPLFKMQSRRCAAVRVISTYYT